MTQRKLIQNQPLVLILATFLSASVPVFAAENPAATAMEPAAQAGTTGGTVSAAPAAVETPTPASATAPASPDAAAVNPAALAPPSQNVTVNLINRLVQRGVLTKEDASELIRQAEADAELAHVQAVAAQNASAQAQAAQAAVAQAVAGQVAPPSDGDSTAVTYIPEVVKQQMRDQIKQEVMDQARDENWAAPRTLPEWTTRIKLFGDLRVRYEGDYYASGNPVADSANPYQSDYWMFNSINISGPFNLSTMGAVGGAKPPYYNVDQDRNRFRIRTRIGLEADLGQGFSAGLRLGSGNDGNPVTESQTLGLANSGQGGNFSRYAVWIDRAFIKYDWKNESDQSLSVSLGRFDNPFFSTSMIWSDDLAFDGGAIQGKYQVAKGVTPFLTIGAFPVFNTDFNFGTYSPVKYQSYDKWLFAEQLGTDWKIDKDINLKVAAAYYYFMNVEGKVSSPFDPQSSQDTGNTDDSRPAFAQSGNTYIALRNIPAVAGNSFGTTNQWQYYGLATPFHELAVTMRLDYNHFEPFQLSLLSEFVDNLAYNYNSIVTNGPAQLVGPQNNLNTSTGAFQGGHLGWITGIKAGRMTLEHFGDWSVGANYRYIESDATVDGFNDADFGAPKTGTNLKGYTLFGNYALSPRVWLGLRWMSANAIAGPAYRNDIIFFDINTKF